ncbi:MAG: symmetrical bis(5'-nucleosyl)-tetraphosphatase [Gammaproteobacteria bacterium]|nr:symmetrical bis(5'-nucleosyl)-tetraphosphatase [Gammaproteobacteria bacterium]
MATYAVGDIQGCFGSLVELLTKLKFDWANDKLWVCGDLVNRGPQSLNTLRYLYEHRQRVKIVLGNHDLHLLAVASGAKTIGAKDNFHDVLEAPDSEELLEWLFHQPLAHYSSRRNILMVHAGVSPKWSLKQTLQLSQEVEQVLKSKSRRKAFFQSMYGNMPDQWNNNLTGHERLRYITNAFTRMRFCYPDGRLEMKQKCAPHRAYKPLQPWYKLPLKLKSSTQIIFGHWAALNGGLANSRFQALDTGAVWGNRLTALNLKTQKRTSIKAT